MPRWLAIAGTLVLVVIVAVLYTKSDSPTLQVSSASQGGLQPPYQITFTGSGFEPQQATVELGQKVIFVDSSAQPMQIASDPYPADSALPALNATAVTPPDGNYSFIFTHSGSFGYHNQLVPQQGGTVTVTR